MGGKVGFDLPASEHACMLGTDLPLQRVSLSPAGEGGRAVCFASTECFYLFFVACWFESEIKGASFVGASTVKCWLFLSNGLALTGSIRSFILN